MANGAIIGQAPDLSEYATKDDLNLYVPTSSITTNIQQGNNNPVSSGAVYDYVQSSIGDLPWKLLHSRSNISTTSYTVSVTQPIQLLKFHITGTCSTSDYNRVHCYIQIGNFSTTYQILYQHSGVVNIDSLLTTAVWIDYNASDKRLYGFDNVIVVENDSMQIDFTFSSTVTADITCDIYHI